MCSEFLIYFKITGVFIETGEILRTVELIVAAAFIGALYEEMIDY